MYVKVHKNGNRWFRNDTGALVGTEISPQHSYYESISSILGPNIFVINAQNRVVTIFRGYFDQFGKFRRVNQKDYSKQSYDFYVFVL